jgi:tRNA (guanine-N7-)-methyltransferase
MAASPGSGPISRTTSSAPSTEASITDADAADRASTGAEPTARPRRVLYGRRSGPGLGTAAKARLEGLLPAAAVTLPDDGTLAVPTLFTPPRDRVWLEIGFGAGEHLAWQARAHPEVGMIGVEPYLDGVARLLKAMERDSIANLRLFTDDARLLLDQLPPDSLERIFVLFADPWPKRRHWKRRIINRETAAQMAELLRDGGELRVATDDPGYRRWILASLLAEPRLDWEVRGPDDWRRRPPDWPPTRYEEKAIRAGRKPVFLRFRRRARTDTLASDGD